MKLNNNDTALLYISFTDTLYLLLGGVMLALVALNDWPAVIALLTGIEA
ncbi:hypothetical protein AB4298_07040 [Shewanella sp. 10N.261.52.F9]|nr:hypothetical protein [Shewanella marinintestina]MCL1147745.1 hypothetical protein [Shewanella marinintestina]